MTWWVISVLAAVVAVLLSLKLVEMLIHLAFVWRLPREYVDSIEAATVSWAEAEPASVAIETLLASKRAAWAPSAWLITGCILRLGVAPQLR